MTEKKTKPKEVKVSEPNYSKEDILKSIHFTETEKDFLVALLPDGNYTVEEAKGILIKNLKGVVK